MRGLKSDNDAVNSLYKYFSDPPTIQKKKQIKHQHAKVCDSWSEIPVGKSNNVTNSQPVK